MTEKFNDEEELQVKSKERVKDFGEVFTNPREVKAMLDLVKEESYRIDSRFLEPACGNGNFLVTILERKLETVEKEHSTIQVDFEKQALVAVSTIYAIDIQEDNCQESRQRMFEIVENVYNKASMKTDPPRAKALEVGVSNHQLYSFIWLDEPRAPHGY